MTVSPVVVWILIALYVVWRLWRRALERSIASDFAKLGMHLQRAPGMVMSLLAPVPFHIRRRYVLWRPDGQRPALDWVTWPALLMAHKAAGEAFRDAEASATLEDEGGEHDIAEPKIFHPIKRMPEGFVVLDDGDVVAGPFADYMDALGAVMKLEGRPVPGEQTPPPPS